MIPIIQILWVVCIPMQLEHGVTTSGRWPATWTRRRRRPVQIFRHNNFKYILQIKCALDEKINPVGRRGGVHGQPDHQSRCRSAQVGQVAGRLQELGDGGDNRAGFAQVELITDSLYKEGGV